ncbi:MAG: DUF3016 domain-containing protein [Pseudomonadota bacterium]
MKPLFQHALGAALLLAGAGAMAAPLATVTFANPTSFSDVPDTTTEREEVFKELGDHFGRLAAKLPAGQELTVEVLDLDLAGRVYPARYSARDLRILKGAADWPQIKMRYTISEGGKVVRQGEERLSDMNYLNRHNRYRGDETLRYEKLMLDDWFRERIVAR